MPQDKTAVEEFLGDVGKLQEDPFKSPDPFAPQEDAGEGDKIAVEEDKVDDKPLPFHKDPKILRFIEKEVARRVPQDKPTQEFRPSSPAETDEVTAVLERIIGNDTPEKQQGVRDLRKVLGNMEEKAAQAAISRLDAQEKQQLEEERAVQAQLDESFEEIEETFSVDLSSNTAQARKTRSEFVDYVRKIAPKDEHGEVTSFPDLPAAWEEFQERSKRAIPANTQAKALASRGVARSTDTTAAPAQTAKNWKSIDKLFGNL